MVEIGRRIEVKAEAAERIRQQAIEEAKEVNILKREKAEQDEKVRELENKVQALQLQAQGQQPEEEK